MLSKCISLSSSAPLLYAGHPHDYQHSGNREYLSLSKTSWVKLWVSWSALQARVSPPTCWEQSWHQLNAAEMHDPSPGSSSPPTALANLDRQIAAANADGVATILTVECSTPWWAAAGPTATVPFGHAPESPLPEDCSTDGPWAWFVGHLCARYRSGAARNPGGPHEPAPGEDTVGYDPYAGNPLGARLTALEICDEPNVRYQPQEGVGAAVAEMIATAEQVARETGGPALLGPGTSDAVDWTDDSATPRGTHYAVFCESVLRELSRWRPRHYVGWSHHNYADVRARSSDRVDKLRELLRRHSWAGDPHRWIWLTEGGFALGTPGDDSALARAEGMQADLIEANFGLMARCPDIPIWTQHGVHDLATSGRKTGLCGDFNTRDGFPGPARPAFERWAALTPPDEDATEAFRAASGSSAPGDRVQRPEAA